MVQQSVTHYFSGIEEMFFDGLRFTLPILQLLDSGSSPE
jgi:hypothetical protein